MSRSQNCCIALVILGLTICQAYPSGQGVQAKETGASSAESLEASESNADQAFKKHQYSKALEGYKSVLSKTPESEWNDRARLLNNIGMVYDRLKQYRRARKHYREALAIRDAHGDSGREDGISCLNNIASSYLEDGEVELAVKNLKEANERIIQYRGADHPSLSVNLNRLAGIYKRERRYQLAADTLRKSLKVAKSCFKAGHPAVAVIQNNLATMLRFLGKPKEAQELYTDSLKIREESLGKTDLRVASGLNSLARSYREQGHYEKALPLLKRSLEIVKKSKEAKASDRVAALKNLGLLMREMGESDKSVPYYEDAIKLQRSGFGENDQSLVDTYQDLAAAYQEQEDYENARDLLTKALAICDLNKTGTMNLRLKVLAQLEDIYGQTDDFGKAIAINEKERGYIEAESEVDNDLLALKLNDLALLHRRQGASREAEKRLKEGLALVEKEYGKDSVETALFVNNLARLYGTTGEFEKAAALYKRLIDIRSSAYGSDSLPVAAAMQNYSLILMKLNKVDEAEEYLDKAEKIEEKQ